MSTQNEATVASKVHPLAFYQTNVKYVRGDFVWVKNYEMCEKEFY